MRDKDGENVDINVGSVVILILERVGFFEGCTVGHLKGCEVGFLRGCSEGRITYCDVGIVVGKHMG
jgi:hypothetical protein